MALPVHRAGWLAIARVVACPLGIAAGIVTVQHQTYVGAALLLAAPLLSHLQHPVMVEFQRAVPDNGRTDVLLPYSRRVARHISDTSGIPARASSVRSSSSRGCRSSSSSSALW